MRKPNTSQPLRLALLALALLVPVVAVATDWVNNAISVTDVSQSITLDCVHTLWVKNAGSTNEIYVCPFKKTGNNRETVTACVAGTEGAGVGRRIDPTETKTWNLGTVPNQCWIGVSIVAASTKTSTARGDTLP